MAQLLQTLEGHSDRVWCAVWSPSGDRIASCGGDRTVRIWRPDTAAPAAPAAAAAASASAGAGASTDAGASALPSKSPLVQQLTSGPVLDETLSRTLRCVDWSPSGRLLAGACFDGSILVWEDVGGRWEVLATLEGHDNEVKCVAWSPDGSMLATCSRDKSVWVWAAVEGSEFECMCVLHGHSQDVKFVKWHPKRSMLISASYDDTLIVWEESDGDFIATQTLGGHSSTVWQLAFDESGDRFVSCSDDCTLRVWVAVPSAASVTWKCVCTISGYHTRTIFTVDWNHANGYIAAAGADDLLTVYAQDEDAKHEEPTFHLVTKIPAAHKGDINCVRWHPTHPSVFATAGDDCAVKVWQLTDAA